MFTWPCTVHMGWSGSWRTSRFLTAPGRSRLSSCLWSSTSAGMSCSGACPTSKFPKLIRTCRHLPLPECRSRLWRMWLASASWWYLMPRNTTSSSIAPKSTNWSATGCTSIPGAPIIWVKHCSTWDLPLWSIDSQCTTSWSAFRATSCSTCWPWPRTADHCRRKRDGQHTHSSPGGSSPAFSQIAGSTNYSGPSSNLIYITFCTSTGKSELLSLILLRACMFQIFFFACMTRKCTKPEVVSFYYRLYNAYRHFYSEVFPSFIMNSKKQKKTFYLEAGYFLIEKSMTPYSKPTKSTLI